MPPPNGWNNPYETDLVDLWEWVIIAQYILMGIPVFGYFASFLIGMAMFVINWIHIVRDWRSTFTPYFSGEQGTLDN